MSFTLLPAVDVADGRAVRLTERGTESTTTLDDPVVLAGQFQTDGAEWIHLVDLDAAYRRGSNAELLSSITKRLDINVELSGGISDDATLDWALSTGAQRIVLATNALQNRTWCETAIKRHGPRIAIALDVRATNGEDGAVGHDLIARGGTGVPQGDLMETLVQLDQVGCARYIVTDVSKDGMLSGPNVELYKALREMTPNPVIASGGISSVADLIMLAEAGATTGSNLEGAIVGKALHTGRFSLPEALQAIQSAR